MLAQTTWPWWRPHQQTDEMVTATGQVVEAVFVVQDELVATELVPSSTSEPTEAAAPPLAVADGQALVAGAEQILGAPLGWSMTSGGGYVFNRDRHRIGRITSWGTSLACKCYMHGGKCSLAKPQRVATNVLAMQWLAAGEGLSTSASSSGGPPSHADLARRHIALWGGVLEASSSERVS